MIPFSPGETIRPPRDIQPPPYDCCHHVIVSGHKFTMLMFRGWHIAVLYLTVIWEYKIDIGIQMSISERSSGWATNYHECDGGVVRHRLEDSSNMILGS